MLLAISHSGILVGESNIDLAKGGNRLTIKGMIIAEDTLIVDAFPTWPATYNYSIITNPDTGKLSIQE